MLCRLRPQCSFSHSRKATPPLLGMVAIAIALPPPSVHEIRLDSDMFVTRINFDFRIAHCEPRVSELLDYTAEELTGKNLYTLCHGEDANRLRKCHLDRKYLPCVTDLAGWVPSSPSSRAGRGRGTTPTRARAFLTGPAGTAAPRLWLGRAQRARIVGQGGRCLPAPTYRLGLPRRGACGGVRRVRGVRKSCG